MLTLGSLFDGSGGFPLGACLATEKAARGMVIQGVEQPLHTHSVEMLDIDTVCDSCGEEIPAGTPARYHYRVGSLHCARCARIPTGGA